MPRNINSHAFLAFCFCILTVSMAWGEITMKEIDFEDLKMEGLEGQTLRLAVCWGALGIDPNDVIYAAWGNNRQGGVKEDCTAFTYDTKTGERTALGTLRTVAQQDGTLSEWNAACLVEWIRYAGCL
jgi:hypothetical protein